MKLVELLQYELVELFWLLQYRKYVSDCNSIVIRSCSSMKLVELLWLLQYRMSAGRREQPVRR